jgi:mono/diheme cytochrome c family protein
MQTVFFRIVLLVAFALTACRSRALREWAPADHDPDAAALPMASGATSGGNGDPLAAAQALFLAQCASCHGPRGRGDGPMAAMFRPADLSDPVLQSQRSDDELARAITQGRGRMPGFGAQLRPEAVPLLVRLIRSWRR